MKHSKWLLSVPAPVMEYAERNAVTQNLFVGWLQEVNGELILRIFGFRKLKKKPYQLREVIRESTDEKISRDLYLTVMSGWRVVYEASHGSQSNWYGYNYYYFDESDFGHWDYADKIGISYQILNLDYLQQTKYKYCGYSVGCGMYLMPYLKLWEQNPEVEYFGKLEICPKTTLLRKVKKDKGFAKFLWSNPGAKLYMASALIYAYDHHCDLDEAQEKIREKHQAIHFCKSIPAVKENNLDYLKVYRYCDKNFVSSYTYSDYLNAVVELGLDLQDTKNLYPKQFRRMHDLRIAEMHSLRERRDAELHKNFLKDFRKAAAGLQWCEYAGDDYLILIPKKVRDLQHEGKVLCHCVGKMGYDAKMVTGTSFIAFLRKADAPEKPFVTIEFGMQEKRILQCYGKNDSRPEQSAIDFANDWAKKIRKKMVKKEG